METQKFLSSSKVLQNLCSKNGSHSYIRSLVLGTVISVTVLFFWSYTHLNVATRTGEVPWFTIDVFIVCTAALQVVSSPFLSWVAYRRRRTIMMSFTIAMAAVSVLVLALPDTRLDNDAAVHIVDRGFNWTAVWRLALVTVMCVTGSMTLIVVWCHGAAYMDEHSTRDMSFEYGYLVTGRILAPLLASGMFDYSSNVWLVAAGLVIPLTIHALQFLKVPEQAPPAPQAPKGLQDSKAQQDLHTTQDHQTPQYPEDLLPLDPDQIQMEGRGLNMTLGRVLTNKLVMTQIVAIGFLAASLWGFAYHERDITKVLYTMESSSMWMETYADILRYHVVILVVVLCGIKFSYPAMEEFNKLSALKVIGLASLAVVPAYIGLVTVFVCQQGNIAGLDGVNYVKPICNLGCPSPPRIIFDPVCLVGNMQTYMTPCHAGCLGSEEFNGTTALTSCACSMNGSATKSACSAGNCAAAFELHKLFLTVVIVLIVVAVQAHGVLILRHTDPRDRSVTLGIAGGVVSLIAFIVGHLVFFGIRASTCAWFEGGRCLLHNYLFPYLVATASAVLALVTVVLTFYSWLLLRNQPPPKRDDYEVATPLEEVQ